MRRLVLCLASLLLTACSGPRPGDAALAEQASEDLYSQGKGTPAQFASDKIRSHFAWVYKRILLGTYKRDDREAQAVARTYMTTLMEEIAQGLAWPIRQPPRFDLPFLSRPPAIDGAWGADEWEGAIAFTGEYPLNTLGRTSPTTRWRAGWDEGSIYVTAQFTDDKVTARDYDPSRSSNPWDGDCFEFFVLPDLRLRAYWELVIDPDNRVVDGLHLNNPEGYWVIGMDDSIHGLRTATSRTTDGYIVEVAIPFSELPGYLRGNPPRSGDELAFTLVHIDDGKRSAFQPLLYDGHNIFGYPRFTLRR